MHHIMEKGFQAGSVVGVGLVVPALALRHRRASGGSLTDAAPRLLKALGTSALVGTCICASMGAARIASLPAEERADGLQDRAYCLHFNKGQQRVDLLSQIGMAVGGTAAMYFVSPAAAIVLGGAAAGVLAHVATAPPKE